MQKKIDKKEKAKEEAIKQALKLKERAVSNLNRESPNNIS